MAVVMRREWAMPNPETFSIPTIAAFVSRWTEGAKVVIDPFARNSAVATHRNDLNPKTRAEYHMEADAFCRVLLEEGVEADVVLFDPPYSPRQISEVYAAVGKSATVSDTQNARLYRQVRDGLDRLLRPGGIALSFGWNSAGFGKRRSYSIEEILLVNHGGGHNDTICMAERKLRYGMGELT